MPSRPDARDYCSMDSPTRVDEPRAILEACQLTRRFGRAVALDDLSLQVPAGQICAVLGQNGAGKTTFIRCALGMLAPTRGQLKVLGAAAGSQAARRATGVMLQDTDLSDALTPREQLTLFATYFDRPADVESLIDTTGIGAFADKRYKHLSGGQKRRVQFAVALAGQPQLLFLDEPTTGLDADARRTVWDHVRRLAEGGTTIILTTHYLEEAEALADRIVVLADGRIVADDATAVIRSRTAGAIVRCRTRLTTDAAAALPGVRAVANHGRLLTLSCDRAVTTLRALLEEDPDVDDLEVGKPSLEQAVAGLAEAAKSGPAAASAGREPT
jgi:ABC-2 type transport system ATP-binding protein